MRMLLSRRTMLAASLGAAAGLQAAGSSRIRAGALITAGNFEALLKALKDLQGLGYTGYSTTMRLLQSEADNLAEMRARLSETGLDLIGVRTSLPKYAELGGDRALDDLARLAMAARQFGSRTLMLHSAGLAADGKFKPEDLDSKAKFFDLCAKRCKETGVIFTYRTQDAEFQNDAAEIRGLIAKTDKNITYYDLSLVHTAAAIEVFHDNPSRTFAMEVPFGDPAFKVHDLSSAVKQTKWISWLIDAAPDAESRAVVKKVFGV